MALCGLGDKNADTQQATSYHVVVRHCFLQAGWQECPYPAGGLYHLVIKH